MKNRRSVSLKKLALLFLLFSCTKGKSLFESKNYEFPGLASIDVGADGSLSLKWDDITKKTDLAGEVKYYIYRKNASSTFNWNDPLDVSDKNIYSVPTYKLNKEYCFAVRYTIAGKNDDNNKQEICPELPYVETFEGIKTAVSSDTGQATITWDAVAGEGIAGYNIYKGDGFSGLPETSVSVDKTTATINNLPVDKPISFGVRVVDKYGREDENTKTISVDVVNNVAPIFDGLVSVTQTLADTVTLKWLAASGSPTGYKIYWASGASGTTPTMSYTTALKTASSSATSISIDGLGDELAHSFVVRAVSSGGQEDKNVVQKTISLPDAGAPVFSGIKTFVFEEGGAKITWDAAVGETAKYRVYYKEGQASAFSFATATIADIAAPSTGTAISGLADNRYWTFAVRAYDSHNQADTNVVTKTVLAGDLTAPSFAGYVGLTALDENRLSIEFNRSTDSDVSHYSIRVKRAGTSDTFTEKTTVAHPTSGATVTATITGLLPATSYDVIVKVIDTSNNPSTNSSYLTRTTLDQTAPTFNGITSVAQKSTDASKAVVTWAAATDAGGIAEYRVYYSKTSLVGQTLLRTGTYPSGSGNATIYMTNAVTSGVTTEIPALDEGIVYYFVVHAIDNSGNEDTNTAQASYTVPYYTPPQPPTVLSVVGGNGPSTNRSPFIAFTSVAGYTVKIYVNGTFNVSKAINASGADTVQLSILPNTTGNYVITASHVNPSSVEGNAASVATYQLQVDTPTASLSGSPSSSTNASALNITVSNASNVNSYKYSLYNNQTTACSAATYSVTWVAVATHITDTLNADGDWRLCVIAKNTAGLEQDPANATVVNFTRDTTPPSAPATLTLSNAITSSTTVTYTPEVTGVVSSVAGASHYCVTPTNSAPTSNDSCWTTSTTTTVILTGNNAYAWAKDAFGNVSTSSTSDSITWTNLCTGGTTLRSGQTCTIATARSVADGDWIAGQGNITITSLGSISGNAEERFTITLSGNLIVQSAGSINGNITINAANVTINGTVSANAKGYIGVAQSAGSPGASGGAISTAANCSSTVGTGGGGHAGAGGNGYGAAGSTGGAVNATLNASQPITFGGSGGGFTATSAIGGGNGGGAIKINASGVLTVDGTVSANGGNGSTAMSCYTGGGAGGSIWLIGGSMSGTGTLSVTGGYGNTGLAGGGGGGAISIASTNAFKGPINIDQGFSTVDRAASIAGSGKLTVSYSNPCDTGDLNSTCTINGPVVWGSGQTFSGSGSLVIANGGSLKSPAKMQYISIAMTGSITVQNGGSIFANLTNVTGTDLTIDSGGTVSADSLGYFGNASNSNAPAGTNGSFTGLGSTGSGGGGHGGRGGVPSNSIAGNSSYAGSIYIGGLAHGSATQPITFGGPGGGNYTSNNCTAGGGTSPHATTGGGAIKISVSGVVTINGMLSANGAAGCGNGSAAGYTTGGAAGGSIWLNVTTLSGTGTITANGGVGGNTAAAANISGGGSGGRIAAYNTNKFLGTVTALGGAATALATSGEPGTVYFANNQDNYCNSSGTMSTTCTISQIWGIANGWTIGGSGSLVMANGGQLYGYRTELATITMSGSVTVQNGGKITGNFTINATNLTVNSGGTITSEGWGYLGAAGANGNGYQAGAYGIGTTGYPSGGAHGGAGGAGGGGSSVNTTAYGTASAPTTFGSAGGGYSASVGGNGGGALRIIVSNTVQIDGLVSSNGLSGNNDSGYGTGGGAGGSIYISAGTFAGNGQALANGGAGTTVGARYGGGGGGGRIKVTATTDTFSGTKTATGGAASGGTSVAGANGTVQ